MRTMTNSWLVDGQIWVNGLGGEKAVEVSPDGRLRMGAPHYVVLAHDSEHALLAPACRHKGRWAQTLIGEGERLLVPLATLSSLDTPWRIAEAQILEQAS